MVACAQPAGAALCAHAAGKVIGIQSHHACNGNRLGSGLSTVALEYNLLVLWQICQCGLHSFSEWDIFLCKGDAGFQIVVLRADVYQIDFPFSSFLLNLLCTHVEFTALCCQLIILANCLFELRVDRIISFRQSCLCFYGQLFCLFLLGNSGETAADIVGILSSQAKQSNGLGSSLSAVAVHQNRLVVWDDFQCIRYIHTVRDIDCTLDMTFRIILCRANIQQAEGFAFFHPI